MSSLLIPDDVEQNTEPMSDCDINHRLYEYQVLGNILLNNDLIDSLNFLKPDHFLEPYHAEVFNRMHDLRNLDEPIKPETLAPFFDQLNGQPFMRYFKKSFFDSYFNEDPIELARQVVELSKRRQLKEYLATQIRELGNQTKMFCEITSSIQGKVLKLSSESGLAKFSTNKEIGDRILKKLDHRENPYSTGLRALDKAMDGGMFPGMCYLMAGRKKMGKTTLAGTISCNLNTANHRHLYINAEMSAEEIEQRNLARLTSSYASSFRNDYGRSEEFKNKISNKIVEINDAIVYLDAPGIPLNDLKTAVAQAVVRYGIKGFILDCLQLVGGKDPRKSQAEHQDDVGQWCATFARERNLFSIITAQVNQTGNIRGGEGVRMACDQGFEIRAPGDDPGRSERWMEMIETRYTAWADVGSKEACVLLMNDNGPFIFERPFESQEPLPL